MVAKSTYDKDREFIRTNAAQKLKRTKVWMNEQSPPEIEEKRKKLYQVSRQAKKDNQSTEKTVRRRRRMNVAYYVYDNYCRQKPAASIAYMC